MAYSGLYERNERKVRQFLDKAKALAGTTQEKDALERFERQYKDRKEFWK
jgi:hypothetical protein